MFNEHVQKPPERLLALIGEINVGNLQRLGHEPHQSVAAGTSRGSGPAVLRRDPADRAGEPVVYGISVKEEYLPHEIIL
jgi:hypothetical protein